MDIRSAMVTIRAALRKTPLDEDQRQAIADCYDFIAKELKLVPKEEIPSPPKENPDKA